MAGLSVFRAVWTALPAPRATTTATAIRAAVTGRLRRAGASSWSGVQGGR
ncbi:hypothetical protein [Streptomyces sp. B1-3]